MDPLMTLTLTAVLNEPFIFLKDDSVNRIGNDKYQGFLIDLMDLIGDRTPFEFELKLQEDRKYGMPLDDGTWNGMVGSVVSGAADMSLADMTITSMREKAVDFTIPYMQTGIQILYQPSMLKMMNAFSSVEDLVNQTSIKFGCVRGGATEKFFKTSNKAVYQKVWETMSEMDEMTDSNQEGIEKVLENPGKYAYLLEAQSAQHAVNQHCGLKIVGERLHNRHYGLAVQRDSGLRKTMNIALLQMMEDGVLAQLEKKWFGKGNSECSQMSNLLTSLSDIF